jgi:adenine-specific DNA-methyltransferase
MVQIPEATPDDSEAFKAGYKNIAELSKVRIRRAGEKIKDEAGLIGQNLDVGFRVLKVDTSNMKDMYYSPDGVKQGDLLDQIENIREDRTPEDLLFQVLLDWGVDLSLPIAQKEIDGKTVFFVDGNALVACFDRNINEELVQTLAARKPLRAVFRDAGFGSDSVKINVEQIFKLVSPSTEVKSI